jgi:SAM-dependent methyltransferase
MSTLNLRQAPVIETSVEKRHRVVRQDRHQMAPGECYIEYADAKLDVVNVSAFGLAVLITNAFLKTTPLPTELNAAKLFHGKVYLQDLHLKEVRRQDKGDSCIEVAYEIFAEPLNVEYILGLELGIELIDQQKLYSKAIAPVPEIFKTHVYEIRDWLEIFRDRVIDASMKIPDGDDATKRSSEAGMAHAVVNFLKEIFPRRHSQIQQALHGASQEQIKAAADFFRTQLKHLIYQAPFSDRAFNKPKGYAGDFEMMNHLYRDEFVGPNLFAKCLHKYFISEPAGQAVRNRATYLQTKIQETFKQRSDDFKRIISIASGPAKEMQKFVMENEIFRDQKAEFTCIDQDEDSLKFAQRQLKTLQRQYPSSFQYQFINKPLKSIIAQGLDEGSYDLIYSAGLFDYLSDPVAQLAAQRLFSSLRKGGRLIIGNFDLENPTLPLMELAWDWHLIYRSPEDLIKLFNHIGADIKIEKEELGINLFSVIQN